MCLLQPQGVCALTSTKLFILTYYSTRSAFDIVSTNMSKSYFKLFFLTAGNDSHSCLALTEESETVSVPSDCQHFS